MIIGFEEYTAKLSDYERDTLLPVIVKGLLTKIGKHHAITNKKMCVALTTVGYKISEPRVRKIINHIRVNGLIINLIATGKGYYISHDIEERRKWKEGMRARAASIIASLEHVEV
tara:strand:- start:219 stop:563 length:345 start_codon:yes stop_codon:yes gene_type:complete